MCKTSTLTAPAVKPLLPLFFLAGLALAVLAGCTRAEKKPDVAVVAAPKEHALTGEVVALTPARSAVLVHHEEIPGYMPPMTMEFLVAPADLARLKEGQRLRARMTQDDHGDLHLEAIELLDPVKEATIAAAANQLRQDTSARGKEAYREVGETVPQFTLYNQDGEVVPINRFRGRRVVLNFIYTRCPIATMCPASTLRMMALQQAAREKGVANLELVSITLDPAYDTPSVLKDYARVRGIDTANFTFLTGPEGAVRDLLHQFGVIVQPGDNYLKHTLATLLLDEHGRIVHRVDGTAWEPKEFLKRL
jgi:protein SCO1/2